MPAAVEWLFCARCGVRLAPASAPSEGHKPSCPACGWFRPTYALPVVLVLAHTADRRVLLGRRRVWPAGSWALIAGFIDTGETAEAAALRELHEEASLVGRHPRVRRTLVRDDLLLVCVEVEIEGEPRAGSDVDEVRLEAANPELIPAEWQAREFVEDYVRGWT